MDIHCSLLQCGKNDDSRSPFGALYYFALTSTYQPEALSAFANQDRLLRLICNYLHGFFNSIYEYEQYFISYKDQWL
jgi:hypothetical protein